MIQNFEVGEEKEISRSGTTVGGSKIIYVTKDNKRYPIGEKKKSKTEILGKLSTFPNYHLNFKNV